MNKQWFDGKAKHHQVFFMRFGVCWPFQFKIESQGGVGNDPYFTRHYTIFMGLIWMSVRVASLYE